MTQVPMAFRLFWIAPIVAGAILSLNALRNYAEAEASRDWSPVSASLYRLGGQRGLFIGQQWGSYRWEFAGKTYEGSEVDCCGSTWGDWLTGQQSPTGEPLQQDAVITVYVNPADPARAVLVPGSHGGCVAPFITGLLLIAAGFWVRRLITADIAVDNGRRGF